MFEQRDVLGILISVDGARWTMVRLNTRKLSTSLYDSAQQRAFTTLKNTCLFSPDNVCLNLASLAKFIT